MKQEIKNLALNNIKNDFDLKIQSHLFFYIVFFIFKYI